MRVNSCTQILLRFQVESPQLIRSYNGVPLRVGEKNKKNSPCHWFCYYSGFRQDGTIPKGSV